MKSAWARRIAIAAGLASGLFVAAVAVLIATFDANRMKSMAVDWMRTEHQRRLVIAGPVELAFFPRLALKVSKVSLSEHGRDDEFAAIDEAAFALQLLLPLLHKQFVIGKVSARGVPLLQGQAHRQPSCRRQAGYQRRRCRGAAEERRRQAARAGVTDSAAGQGGAGLDVLRGITVPVVLSGPFDAIDWKIQWSGVASAALRNQVRDKLTEALGARLGVPADPGGAASAPRKPEDLLKDSERPAVPSCLTPSAQ